MDNTPNINLKKPKPEDYYNIKDHNDNSDILDTKIKELDAGKIGKDMIGQNNGVAGVSAQGKITPMPSAADIGAVPTSRTINTKPLSANITLKASDVGAVDATQLNVPNGVAGIGSDGKLNQVPSAAKLSGELFIVSTTQPPVQEGKIWLKPIS